MIYTGIDAEREFNPDLATPVPLEPDLFHVLYLGRWVDQKDPLLMIEVAARLHRRTSRACGCMRSARATSRMR